MKYRLRAEHPTHFEVEDGKGVFKVAKAGLDSELVKRIQSFADGGAVGGGAGEDVPPLDVMELPDAGPDITPDMRTGGKGPRRLKTESEQYPGLLKPVTGDDAAIAALGETLRPGANDPFADKTSLPGNLLQTAKDLWSDVRTGYFQPPRFSSDPNSPLYGPPAEARTIGGVPASGQFDSEEVQKATAAARKAQGYPAQEGEISATDRGAARRPPSSRPGASPGIGGSGRAGGPSPSTAAAPDAEAAAMRGQADVVGRQGAEESTAIKDQMSRMADLEAHRQAMTAQWDAEYKGQLRKYSEAVDRYSNTEIQPDRLWASRSTGDKMLAGVGMLLSAFGPGDVNRSVELIDRAISQDIEVQKSNLERLGKSAGMHQNLLGIMREHFGDEMAAEAAARESMTANAQLQLKEVAARYQGPQAQANAAAGIAALQTKRAQWQSEFDLKAKATASEVAKNYAEAKKLGAAGGAGGGQAAALAALKRFEKAWQGGGGMLGSISKHFPGDTANSKDVEAQRTALASEIASSLGKGSGRAAFILKGLPQVGEDQAIGQKKIAALRAAIMAEQGGGGAEEGSPGGEYGFGE